MAQGSEHIPQILAFVLDNFQVVSYKWLSRKFSISSNEAKRLLQSFVEQHGNSVEVIYAVAGWSKTEPRHYAVQLVSKSKLQQAKDTLEGHVSSHVYSVQPCIPKDSAELWSAEYVQSEELFNQPPEINNCLRDNRFSAVSCLSVHRTVLGKNHHIAPSTSSKASVPDAPSSSTSKPRIVQAEVPRAPSATSGLPFSSNQASATIPGNISKGVTMVPSIKKATETTFQGGGSLSSLWGRASSKARPNSLEGEAGLVVKDAPPPVTGGAEPRICALDSSFEASSDDDAADFARLRRGQVKNSSGRKRLVVFDDEISDVEKEDMNSESIVSLASLELPRKGPDLLAAVLQKKKPKQKPGIASTEKLPDEKPKITPVVKIMGTSSPDASPNGKHIVSAGLEVKEAKDLAETEAPDCGWQLRDDFVNAEDAIKSKQGADFGGGTSGTVKPGTKKRKVIKTHIDGRGREVTEVVWEEFEDTTLNEKDEVPQRETNAHVKFEESKSVNKRSVVSANASNAVLAPPNRASSKSSGKSSMQHPKQGNILSFFKKKS